MPLEEEHGATGLPPSAAMLPYVLAAAMLASCGPIVYLGGQTGFWHAAAMGAAFLGLMPGAISLFSRDPPVKVS